MYNDLEYAGIRRVWRYQKYASQNKLLHCHSDIYICS